MFLYPSFSVNNNVSNFLKTSSAHSHICMNHRPCERSNSSGMEIKENVTKATAKCQWSIIETLSQNISDMATPIPKPPNRIDDKSKNTKPKLLIGLCEGHNGDDYVDWDDFYHIKECYQHVPKTQPSSCSITPHIQRNSSTHSPILPTTSSLPLLLDALGLLLFHICRIRCSMVMSRRWLIIASCMLLLHVTTTPPMTMAAPQSCILCDKNDLKSKDPQTNYEEFLFEHQVTRLDAINALKKLNESFYDGLQADSSCNAVRCTEKVSKYCLGPQFINDHCWCEFGHSTEGLPFVPHMCYVGEKVYKPSIGSCFLYEEVKDCCCSALLAREWRHISASPSLHRNSNMYFNYSVIVITFLYRLIRRLL
ncbi:uncharacterized protein LOC106091114 isoform X3 [Stomoxys calcitrans]|uniref:uncharacterized protein LOC106091114 isoform X3 n=1 Tax=Stomoxys calcitrans TaxID=35570 RepID=UPI0027E2DE6A|nr:uncharacterized protein LOC106091114 isoform X3 [Stomoxys calcitrans]